MAAPNPTLPLAIRNNVVRTPHRITYRATATDGGWAAAGGPAGAIPLSVTSFDADWDIDRSPMGRHTLVATPPAEGVRWLSPLSRNCLITVWATYDNLAGTVEETRVGSFMLRRRRRSWPGGDVVLDLATRDADLDRDVVAMSWDGI